MDATFLQARITAVKAQIVALEDTLIDVSSGAVESYTLDTGQSRQAVTNSSVKQISDTIDSLYNRLAVLQARLTGNGTVIGRPAW